MSAPSREINEWRRYKFFTDDFNIAYLMNTTNNHLREAVYNRISRRHFDRDTLESITCFKQENLRLLALTEQRHILDSIRICKMCKLIDEKGLHTPTCRLGLLSDVMGS